MRHLPANDDHLVKCECGDWHPSSFYREAEARQQDGSALHQHQNYDCGGKGHGSDVSEVQWCHDCTPHTALDGVAFRHEPTIYATNTEDGYLRCQCGWPDPIEEGHFTEHFAALPPSAPPALDEKEVLRLLRLVERDYDDGLTEPESEAMIRDVRAFAARLQEQGR